MSVVSEEAVGELLCDHFEDGWATWHSVSEPVEVVGLGTVTRVQSIGGGEGEGEHVHVVLQVVDRGEVRFFKQTGYYASYDGTTWDGPFEAVVPNRVMITEYVALG